MLNILGCLDRPTAGQYVLGGRDVSGLDDDELSRERNRRLAGVYWARARLQLARRIEVTPPS